MNATTTLSQATASDAAIPATPRTARRIGRAARLAAAMLMATVAAGAAVGSAAAASGSVGQHGRAAVTCDALTGPRMLVHLPHVGSVPVSRPNVVTIGGWTGGGTHPQWVGVRVWLLKWNPPTNGWVYTDQNRDGFYDRLPLLQIQVLSDMNVLGGEWWNADAKRAMAAGDTQFPIRDAGHYKLNVEYFWYADQEVGSGYDLLDSRDHFYEQYTVVSKPYCSY
jgi:hypothetical protein